MLELFGHGFWREAERGQCGFSDLRLKGSLLSFYINRLFLSDNMTPLSTHPLTLRTTVDSEGLIPPALFFPAFPKATINKWPNSCHIFLMFSEPYLLWVPWTIFKPTLSASPSAYRLPAQLISQHWPLRVGLPALFGCEYFPDTPQIFHWLDAFSVPFFPHSVISTSCTVSCQPLTLFTSMQFGNCKFSSSLNKHIICVCLLFFFLFFQKDVGIFKFKLLPCS